MPKEIVVVSYNIHGCVGADGDCAPQRVLAVLQSLRADVIGLQEVDTHQGEEGIVDQLLYASSVLGMTGVAGYTLFRRHGPYGNAILTRFPVLSVNRLELTVLPQEPRGALDVTIDVHHVPVRFVATHLGLGWKERRTQMRRLMDHLDGYNGPMVLMGDMNEWWPWGEPLRWLHGKFGRPPSARTYPSGRPLLALDRVWVRPRQALVKVQSCRTVDTRMASDHLPVRAVIDVDAFAALGPCRTGQAGSQTGVRPGSSTLSGWKKEDFA